MNKSQFIKSIKEQDSRFKKHGVNVFIAFMFMFFVMGLTSYFFPFESNDNKNIFNLVLLIGFLVISGVISHFNDKIIYKETGMICPSCKKTYEQGSLAIMVLENKCNKCGASLYES